MSKKTLEILYKIKPSFASIGVYEPFPGTRLFDVGVEHGLVNKEMSYEDFFTRIPSDYYLKDVNRRVDTMDFGDFVTLENEVKDAFTITIKVLCASLKGQRQGAVFTCTIPESF